MCANWKLEKVLFPFSTCEGGSSDHHLKIPSRKVKLAYPYIKEKDVVPLTLSFFFSSPPPYPERPGAEAAGARKERRKKRVHQADTPGGTRSFENMNLDSLAPFVGGLC